MMNKLIAVAFGSVVMAMVWAGDTEDSDPMFDSVRERVLPFGVPCMLYLFQFHNGEIFQDGHGPGTTAEQAAQDQKQIDDGGGVDLFAFGSKKGFQLVGKGCLFVDVPDDFEWEKTRPEIVVRKMREVAFVQAPEEGAHRNPFAEATGGGFGVTHVKVQELPVTYFFKTERREFGVLEILKIVENERGYSGSDKGYGMKFRYKMMGVAEKDCRAVQ